MPTNILSRPRWTFRCSGLLLLGWLCAAVQSQAQMTDVLTYHNDPGRTGQTLHEEVLTLANVNLNQFGKLWTLHTDEKSYAQPLYVAGAPIPGIGLRNVVFVETEHDSVYAFDADSTNLLWKVSLCGSNEIPFQFATCSIVPEIGITSTPVIDRAAGSNGTIFIVAASQDGSGACHQRLHALDLATGEDRLPPRPISGVYPGVGDDSANGFDYFAPAHYVNRAALLLLNGVVYIAWSAHCNSRPSTSWVMGYDEQTLAQRYIVNLEPNSYWGSIWNAGGGPAADPQGNIYVALGNGGVNDWYSGLDTNGFPNDQDYGCCLVKLAVTNSQLAVVDYFATSDIAVESYLDEDLGSSCPVVLPDLLDTNGVSQQLVVISGKNQNIYLADRTNLGKYNTTYNAIYQELDDIFPGPPNSVNGGGPDSDGGSGGMWSVPAYFNGVMYYGPVRNNVMALPFTAARLASVAASRSPATNGYPGATPTISANGTSSAIVWTMECLDRPIHEATGAVMHAYAATNLADELYNTSQATNDRDALGLGQKFSTPMVASGRVYVLSSNSVVVYGLLDSSALTPIQQWRAAHFGNPSNVGAGADAACLAGDGAPNLVKYALGLDPFAPVAQSKLGAPSLVQEAGEPFLDLSLLRLAQPADIQFIAESSTDLLHWIALSNSATIFDAPTNLVIQDNKPATNGASYLRLRVRPSPAP